MTRVNSVALDSMLKVLLQDNCSSNLIYQRFIPAIFLFHSTFHHTLNSQLRAVTFVDFFYRNPGEMFFQVLNTFCNQRRSMGIRVIEILWFANYDQLHLFSSKIFLQKSKEVLRINSS